MTQDLEVVRGKTSLWLSWKGEAIRGTSEDLHEALFWHDFYFYPDVVEGDPKYFYIYDAREDKVYLGRYGKFELIESDLSLEDLEGA